jgi:hypothetical protein
MFKKFKQRRIFLAYREIVNFFYIKRTAKRESKTATWQSFALRVDWVGRIYTVLNLRKEDIGDEDLVKRTKLLEKMVPINKYLSSLDLSEIVFPAMEQVSDRSYLVVYSPIFKNFTLLYAIRILLIIAVLTTIGIFTIPLFL